VKENGIDSTNHARFFGQLIYGGEHGDFIRHSDGAANDI
jgi:hypothetical protein